MDALSSSPTTPRPARPRRVNLLWRGSLLGRAWWPVAILLLALLLRAPGLTRSVWEDEVSSFLECRPGYEVPIFQMTGSTPTAYWTSYRAFAVCDWLIRSGSAAVTRLPMLALGLGGVWLGWRLGRLWRNWLAGFLLALLLAVWPFKADWDVQVRYYSVLMFMALLQWVACEAWRLRPQSAARFAAAAVVTLLGALSHILGPVLLAVPWIYLAWLAAGQAWRLGREQMRNAECGLRKEKGDQSQAGQQAPGSEHWTFDIGHLTANNKQQTIFRRRWGRLALELGIQAALLAAVTLTAVQYNRGADWLAAKAEALAGPRPQIRLLEKPGAPKAKPEAPARRPEQLPTPGAFAAYAWGGFKASFKPGAWSPAPLVGLRPIDAFFIELVRGSGPAKANPPADFARWILVGMLAGSLALLFVSPPLLASLWLMILATGLLLQANLGSHFMATRYLALPGLAGVVLLAAGLAGAVGLVRWVLVRLRRRRWAAWAGLGAAAAGFFALAVAAGPAAWQGAGVVIQDWKGLVRSVPEKHPGGTLYVGVGAKCINFYRELAAPGGGDYWRSPLRSRALETFDAPGLREMALIDRFNAFDSVALFRYEYWSGQVAPFKVQAGLVPPFSPLPPAKGVVGSVADLGRRVYVTRGHASLLVRPRLRDPQAGPGEAGRRWRLECLFEVPGVYEMTVITPHAVGLTTVTDPMNLPLKLAARPLGEDEVASATRARAGGALPFGLAEAWRGAPGERLPLPGAGARAWSGQLATGADPTKPVALTLRTDAAPGAEALVVRFRLIEQGDWVRLTSSYDIGPMHSWEDRDNFYFAAPLRLQTAAPRNLVPRLYLEELGTNKDFGAKDFPIEADRGWAPGDLCLLGPLTIPKAKAPAVAGKTMLLGVLPLVVAHPGARDPFVRDPFVERRHIYRPLQHYCLAYVRIMQEVGLIRAQFALPRD